MISIFFQSLVFFSMTHRGSFSSHISRAEDQGASLDGPLEVRKMHNEEAAGAPRFTELL